MAIGILLALGILFWIPTHILTFSMRYFDDYQAAGVPTFPSTYGFRATRATIAVSSILAALAMGAAAWGIGMSWGFLRLLGVLVGRLAPAGCCRNGQAIERVNFGLFKYASVYMLAAMLIVGVGAM